MSKNKKILITGGGGFIAKNLFEQLCSGYVISSCNSSELDLLDTQGVFEYIKSNCFDVVIHTATYDPAPKGSTKDPSKVLANNLKMFFNIVRCGKYFGKMIYFGSGAEYDRRYWQPKMKEEYFGQHVPADQYGFSKYIMTKYAESNDGIYNLRIMSVFGKYEDWRYRFISRVCCQAVLDMPIIIEQNKNYDFLYIDDLVRIVDWFINNKPSKSVYNVCAGQSYDLKTLAGKVIEISDKNLEIIVKTRDMGMEYGGDNSILLSELEDFTFTPIKQSIEKLYHWYDSNRHIIDRNELL